MVSFIFYLPNLALPRHSSFAHNAKDGGKWQLGFIPGPKLTMKNLVDMEWKIGINYSLCVCASYSEDAVGWVLGSLKRHRADRQGRSL
jgi:hypothetical protein